MKLAIFTLPLHANYGGILQAYALQTTLERMGHEVVVMNHLRYSPLLFGGVLRALANWAGRKLLLDLKLHIEKGRAKMENMLIRQHTDRFTSRYIHSRWLKDLHDFSEGEVDAFVVGSDQIWRGYYFEKSWVSPLPDAFLDFASGWRVKRWAYGVSFGVDTWEFPEELTPHLAELMQLFEGVSVREDSAIQLCRKHLGVEAQHVLDPTMLLAPEDYQRLIDNAHSDRKQASQPFLSTYILDYSQEKENLAKRVAHEKGLEILRLGALYPMEANVPLEERLVPPVEDWLRGMAEAEMVVTDSFHGCVFSILFHKPFIAIGNPGRGLTRMESLLRQFHLEDHLLTHAPDYDPERTYDLGHHVDALLDQWRQRSLRFLKQIG